MTIAIAPLKILDEVASDLYNAAKKALTITKDTFVSELAIGIGAYIESKYHRYSRVHTLLSPHEPVKINDIYVNPNFSHKEETIIGEAALEFIIEKRIVILQAIAGHGKSIFVRKNISPVLH